MGKCVDERRDKKGNECTKKAEQRKKKRNEAWARYQVQKRKVGDMVRV